MGPVTQWRQDGPDRGWAPCLNEAPRLVAGLDGQQWWVIPTQKVSLFVFGRKLRQVPIRLGHRGAARSVTLWIIGVTGQISELRNNPHHAA